MESLLKKIIDGNTIHLEKVFTNKRTDFAHEKEVRLLTHFDFKYVPNDSKNFPIEALEVLFKNGEITQEELDKTKEEISREEIKSNVIYVEYGQRNNFIISVMLHPQAMSWFDETFKKYCEKNSLHYLGKSDLYKLNIH